MFFHGDDANLCLQMSEVIFFLRSASRAHNTRVSVYAGRRRKRPVRPLILYNRSYKHGQFNEFGHLLFGDSVVARTFLPGV